jgi:uncharacterized protein (TIGR00269 family)
MRCKKCDGDAVMDIKRANAAFCKEHFNEFFTGRVKTAIREFSMFKRSDRIMVCVSGGKDSLVLWYVLHKLGYNVSGMYIDLGIEGYSEHSKAKVSGFADKFGLESIIVDLAGLGYPIPQLARKTKRHDCAVCGTVKRYYFNKIALDNGFSVVATGHNLDDEASRFFGNIMRWSGVHIASTAPVLMPSGEMLKKKVKPLVRLTEKETAAFALLNGIDYVFEECPMSKGATSIVYKDALNTVEEQMPGSVHFFYFQFLENASKWFNIPDDLSDDDMKICESCGMETFLDKCTFCRLVEKMK